MAMEMSRTGMMRDLTATNGQLEFHHLLQQLLIDFDLKMRCIEALPRIESSASDG